MYDKQHYEKHKEYYNAYSKKWNKENTLKRKSTKLKYLYGITLSDYEKMLFEQGGGCAICGDNPPEGKYLHVDHDHQTNKVRSLLCGRCNKVLGSVGENTELLLRMAGYIRLHQNKGV
jgi:Autographiviridae endonuclease VII